MPVLMILVENAAGLPSSVPKGELSYLERYDPDGVDGLGSFVATPDRAKARRFDTLEDALQTWRLPSRVRPRRDDGLPNRPLTAFTVTFETVDA